MRTASCSERDSHPTQCRLLLLCPEHCNLHYASSLFFHGCHLPEEAGDRHWGLKYGGEDLEQCSSPGVCGLVHGLASLPFSSPEPPEERWLPHSLPSEERRSYPTTMLQTHEDLAFWFFIPSFLPARRYNGLAYFVSLACKGT